MRSRGKAEKLIAIDVHVHAESSCRRPLYPIQAEFDQAASDYFKVPFERPSVPDTIAAVVRLTDRRRASAEI